MRTNAAIAKVYDAVKLYTDTHNTGSNLADAAHAAGATPVVIGPLSANGRNVAGQQLAGLTPKMLKIAFSLSQGQESDMTDDGEGEYFAIRLDKITPPALPALADIRPQLTQAYMQNAVMTALQARADAAGEGDQEGPERQ